MALERARALEVPAMEEIQRIVREILPKAPGMPEFPFEYGRVYMEEPKWYKVEFKQPFAEVPSVLLSAEIRTGWFRPKRYVVPTVKISIPKAEVPSVSIPTVSVPKVAVPSAPSIGIPRVELPKALTIRIPSIALPSAPTISIPRVDLPKAPSISIPTIRVPTVEIARISRGDLRPTVRDQFRATLGDWGWLNWARNAIADGPGWVVGSFLNWLWDVMIQPQIDKVRDAINRGLRSMTSNTQAAINTFRDHVQSSVNTGLSDARSKVQAALNAYRDYIQRSVNAGLADARAKTQAALNTYQGNIQGSVNAGLADSRAKTQAALNAYRDYIFRSP